MLDILFLTKKETHNFLHFEWFSSFDLQVLDFAIEAKRYWEKVEIRIQSEVGGTSNNLVASGLAA